MNCLETSNNIKQVHYFMQFIREKANVNPHRMAAAMCKLNHPYAATYEIQVFNRKNCIPWFISVECLSYAALVAAPALSISGGPRPLQRVNCCCQGLHGCNLLLTTWMEKVFNHVCHNITNLIPTNNFTLPLCSTVAQNCITLHAYRSISHMVHYHKGYSSLQCPMHIGSPQTCPKPQPISVVSEKLCTDCRQ